MSFPATVKLKVMEAVHADYDADRIDDHAALYGGGSGFKDRADRFLVKREIEEEVSPDHYAKRLKATPYVPRGSVLDYIVGAVHEDEPRFEVEGAGATKKCWEALNRDVDGSGMDLAALSRQLLYDMLIHNRAWPYVTFDSPYADPTQPATMRARLSRHAVESVTDWGAAGEHWVKIYSEHAPRPNAWTEPPEPTQRWQIITANGRAVYEYNRKGKSKATKVPLAKRVKEEEHDFPRLPVWLVRFPMKGQWIMDRLAPVMVALYNRESAHQYSLDVGAFPQAVISGANVKGKLYAGQSIAMQLRAGESFAYVSPDAGIYAPSESDIERLRMDILRVVQGVALEVGAKTQAPRAGAFGVAAMSDPMNALLRSYAAPLRDVLESIVAALREFRRDTAEVKVAGFGSFTGSVEKMAQAVGQRAPGRESGSPPTPPEDQSKGTDKGGSA
jgi:hypothetical protein